MGGLVDPSFDAAIEIMTAPSPADAESTTAAGDGGGLEVRVAAREVSVGIADDCAAGAGGGEDGDQGLRGGRGCPRIRGACQCQQPAVRQGSPDFDAERKTGNSKNQSPPPRVGPEGPGAAGDGRTPIASLAIQTIQPRNGPKTAPSPLINCLCVFFPGGISFLGRLVFMGFGAAAALPPE